VPVYQAVATRSSLLEPIRVIITGALYLLIFPIGQAMRGGLR
jgi:hypothetical protein